MLVDVQVHDEKGWTIISIVGEFDLAVAPSIRHAIAQALGPSRLRPVAPRVVLDLGAVHFIDSSGLGLVLGVLRRVRSAEGELRVVVAERQVRDLFTLLRLDTIVDVWSVLAEAVDTPSAPEAAVVRSAHDNGRHG